MQEDDTTGVVTLSVDGNPVVTAVTDPATGGINGLAAQNGKNLGVTIGVVPSGDTTGATDVANINAALASAGRVILSQDADYYVNAPIVLNAYYTLAGYATMGNTLEGQGYWLDENPAGWNELSGNSQGLARHCLQRQRCDAARCGCLRC